MKARDPMFILYVNDMARAVRFYRDCLSLRLVQETPGWSMLRLGNATIALHILGPDSAETTQQHAGLNLQVDDLYSAIEEALSFGATHIVTREPDGFVPVRMCELKDPDGNGIELREFVGPGEDLTRT